MRRTITAAVLSVGLAVSSLLGGSAIAQAKPAPIAAVHAAPRTEATQAIEIPANIKSIPVRLAHHDMFRELKHPWYNLVRRPRLEAQRRAAARAAAPQIFTTASVSIGNYSGFQACVIARESGGNPQIMNASGHYGLYQFSESTWIAYGGSAADFGHASVAEQNQVFANAIAAGGESNWAPYDGC
jgi:Transglycosylase-like domain